MHKGSDSCNTVVSSEIETKLDYYFSVLIIKFK